MQKSWHLRLVVGYEERLKINPGKGSLRLIGRMLNVFVVLSKRAPHKSKTCESGALLG
jgi:hypothetical protein